MKKVLVTGARGFIGRNLVLALGRDPKVELCLVDLNTPAEELEHGLDVCNVIFHLAGVNRPPKEQDFEIGNVGSLAGVLSGLEARNRRPQVVLSSSTQALLDNAYGRSKRRAEEILLDFAARTETLARIFRLPGVFGKWCRPNYNSVVATFCHNVAHDIPIRITDPARELELVHIDDVVASFLGALDGQDRAGTDGFYHVEPIFKITLNRLAKMIQGFHDSRKSLIIPDFLEHFTRCLYSTYISYLPTTGFVYSLEQREDSRGTLAEMFKSPHFGQIFVSRTRPGIVRGNHYHDMKVEKFAVLEGEAAIRFRDIQGDDVIEYRVSGKEFRVVDIPPGYTHSIENVGQSELIVLFWAYEPLNLANPDTYPLTVRKEK